MSEPMAWLVLAVGENRQHGGNDGYEDEPASHYSWDSTVPNHNNVTVDDVIVLWNKAILLGASVVDFIELGAQEKPLYRCANCGLAGIKARRSKSPRFKCYNCKSEFEEAVVHRKMVTTYRSNHSSEWVNLEGLLSGEELRSLCVYPRSQLSLRRLHWEDFRIALDRVVTGLRLHDSSQADGAKTQSAWLTDHWVLGRGRRDTRP
jgi:hypothetical protein